MRRIKVLAATALLGAMGAGAGMLATTQHATADPTYRSASMGYCHEAAHDSTWLTYVATHDGAEQSRVMYDCDHRGQPVLPVCQEDQVCALWEIRTTGHFTGRAA